MKLADENPLPTDGEVVLEETEHVYTARGVVVPRSVTNLVQEDYPFDKEEIIRKNLWTWRHRASSPYHKLVKGVGDFEAVQNVVRHWDAIADAGTAMHRQCENYLNGLPTVGFPKEIAQLKAAVEGWEIVPIRSELSVAVFGADGAPVVAGQIDLLAEVDDELYICDFKRTTKDLSSGSEQHAKYSLQTSLYWVMLEKFTKLKITGCALIQLHEDIEEAFVVRCLDRRERARELLAKYEASI